MVEINDRLRRVFDVVCSKHCRHRKGKSCELMEQQAKLEWCPIGEWWDLNHYLNNVDELTLKIMTKLRENQEKKKRNDEKKEALRGALHLLENNDP